MIDQYIEQYGKRLFGLCCTLCSNSSDAEDLYQETWLMVCRKIHHYNTSRPFEPWLTAICVNLWRDQLRRNKSSPVFNDFATIEEKEAVIEAAASEYGQNNFDEQPDYSDLREAIDRLPEKLRLTVILFYFHGWDIRHTADSLQIPTGTVKSRLHHAKKLLRKELANEPDLQF